MAEKDIVERLQEACVGKPAKIPWPHYLLHEAADEIERLRAETRTLRNVGVDLLTRAERAEAVVEAAQEWRKHQEAYDDFDGDRRGIADWLYRSKLALLSALAKYDKGE